MVRLKKGIKMKRTELSAYNDKAEIEALIEQKFALWEEIFANGHDDMSFMSDGLRLNNLRNDITQLRARLERLFGTDLAGQLSLFGGEVAPERPLPDIMPASWNAPKTLANRQARLKSYFG